MTLLECKTYRTRPHAEGMGDFTYRTRGEVADWKTRCPIAQLRQTLIEDRLAEEAELADIEAEIKQTVEEAQQFAREHQQLSPAGDRLGDGRAVAGRIVAGAAGQCRARAPVSDRS